MYNPADLEIRENRRIVLREWDSDTHFTYVTIIEAYGSESERKTMLKLILTSISA